MPNIPVSRFVHVPHPGLCRLLKQVTLVGLAMVVVWPAARGDSAWLGWWPLWLLGMPLSAWWALHRFPMSLRPLLAWVRARPRTQARWRVRQPPSVA
ncbi:hypothetical protein [Xanthomonas albilineans]|uniref:hypothetical protein n=1 Tax=Xanthomonas albilineans TaxID=29447 RepID=UPI0005F3044B|nr:hypothetical protein [Xanthomonas albilineans]PPU93488.1 hypothetical protein XalbCFBP2523_06135 [Xanthomonas albilineans]